MRDYKIVRLAPPNSQPHPSFSGEVHKGRGLAVEGFEARAESFQLARGFRGLQLRSRITEVLWALRVVVVLRTRADNIRV